MKDIPNRALVVTPHPDDAEIACGGTIAEWIKHGTEVFYVLCTDGGKGTDDPTMTSTELSKIRKEEQLKAANLLGVKEVICLEYPDGEMEDSRDSLREMVRAVRRFRPEVVIAPDPHRLTFYFHRDHRITGQVVQDAVFPYSRDRLHFPELEDEGLKPFNVETILFWGAEDPDTFIDITESMDLKVRSVLCHSSQISPEPDGQDLLWLKKWSKDMGNVIGVSYAEGFRKVDIEI